MKYLALAVGLMFALRIFAVIWPAYTKKTMRNVTRALSDSTIRSLGIITIAISIVLFYFILNSVSLVQILAVALALGLLSGGTLLMVPRLARSFWREDIATTDMNMRILALLEVIIGMLLIYFIITG